MNRQIPIFTGVLVFLVFYVFTAYWNILTPDDLYFANNLKLGGVKEAVWYEYTGWSTRFTSVFFNQLLLSLNSKALFVLRDIMTLALLFGGVYSVLKRYAKEGSHFLSAALYSICIFYSILTISESWFWHCASFTYGWTIGVSFLIIGLLRKELKWSNLLGVALTSFYLGGASAPIAIIAIILLFIAFVFKSRVHKAYLYTALILIALSFTLLVVGPGNDIRRSMLPEVSVLSSIWINIKSIIKLYLFKLPVKLPFMILAAWLVSMVPNQWKLIRLNREQLVLLYLAMFGLLVLYHWPIAYAMGEIAADRALAIVFVAHQVFFILVGWSKRESSSAHFLWLFPVLMIMQAIIFLPVHRKYSIAVNNRYKVLKSSNEKVIELKRLPHKGMYRNAELTEYGHLKKYFELKGELKLLEE